MKRLVTASALVIALMASSANAATLLSIAGGANIALPGTYNPTPGTAPAAVPGTIVTDTQNLAIGGAAATGGLVLGAKSKITFTFLGREAGFRNIVFQGSNLFGNNAAAGTSVTTFGVVPTVLGSFLPFKFISDFLGMPKDIVNGANTATFGSIAFKLLAGATATKSSVIAFLNDSFTGDADYDDMVVRIDAVNVGNGTSEVPVPGAIVLLLSGLAGLGFMGRSRSKAS
jgi:hypothetical protein